VVIPIEDTRSRVKKGNRCIGGQHNELEVEDQQKSVAVERSTISDGLLSAELRDQFEHMKSIWRQAHRGNDDERSLSSNDSSQPREKRFRVREDLKRKQREAAVETAIQVETEITAWQNGIADLEALLAAEEDEESSVEVDGWQEDPQDGEHGPPGIREIAFVRRHNNNAPRQRPPQIRFPFLPQAIPTEDETEEEEDVVTMSTAASSRI